MEKIVTWWNDHRPTKRRLIQLYSALLYNAYVKGFIKGSIYTGKTKALCVPGFNCYSCPGAVGACPLGSLQAALASSGQHIGFYMIGIILLYGLIGGRTICGWICPLGLIQELLHKIPTPKIKKSRYTRALTYLKYIILAVFVVAIPMWYGLKHSMAVPGFCKYICPAGTFEGAMGLLSNESNTRYFGMLGILFTRKFIIMLLIGLGCVFCYRAFCRFLCPLGALYGMFNRLALIGIKVDMGRCNGCGSCVRGCKMDVRHVGDHECIHCAHCIASCPQGAITLKAGNFILKSGDKGEAGDNGQSLQKRKKVERIAWITALAVLVIALIWYNFLDPSGKDKTKDPSSAKTEVTQQAAGVEAALEAGTKEDENAMKASEDENNPENSEDPAMRYMSDAPIGYEVGDQLADFTAQCLDGSTFHLYDNRGKVTIINLWATYCGPCVQELPHFNELYHEHEDDIAILAVHSNFVAQDVGEFLEDKDLDILFTIDNEDEEIFGIVNGSAALPQTIVLNRKGEVTYNEVRPVTPELLDMLYEEAAGGEEGSLASETGSSDTGSAEKTEPEGAENTEPSAQTEPEGAESGVKAGPEGAENAESSAQSGDTESSSKTEQEGTEKPEAAEAEKPETTAGGSGKSDEAKGSDETALNDQGSEAISGSEPEDAEASEVLKEGVMLKDFTVKLTDGSTFDLTEEKGKVVMIALWATYSKPSVDWLEIFNSFCKEHKEEVSPLLVHPGFTTQDVSKYLKKKRIDIPSATDSDEQEIFNIVNGSMTLPQIVVLNKEGEVVYNDKGELSAGQLQDLLNKASDQTE